MHGCGPRAKRARELGGRAGEARIVGAPEAREKEVGAVEVVDVGEAQFRDQAILKGLEEALDPALGLGRERGNPADAEVVQDTTDLRGVGAAPKLLWERQGAFDRHEDAMPIGVDGQRDPMVTRDVLEEQEVAMRIFLLAEGGGKDFPGGIVHRDEQDEAGTPALQPVMLGAIELDEHARLRHALTPTAMPGRAPGAWAGDPGGTQDAPERCPRDRQLLALCEELREVLVIGPAIGRLREGDHTSAQSACETLRRRTPLIAMDQGVSTTGAIPCPQAPDLPQGESEQCRGLPHPQLGPLEGIQDHQPVLCAIRQGNRLPHHGLRLRLGGGRTFSLAV